MHYLIAGVLFLGYGLWKGFQVHAHRCDACGALWSHNGFHFGESESHSCPKCGAPSWVALPEDAWHFGADGALHLSHEIKQTVPPPAPAAPAKPPTGKPS